MIRRLTTTVQQVEVSRHGIRWDVYVPVKLSQSCLCLLLADWKNTAYANKTRIDGGWGTRHGGGGRQEESKATKAQLLSESVIEVCLYYVFAVVPPYTSS